MRIAFFLVAIFLLALVADARAQDTTTASPLSAATLSTDSVKPSGIVIDSSVVAVDSVPFKKKMEKRHSAKKAAWMSAVLPGLGQAYNKRWWKIPIVYAGFAGLGYGLYHFGSNFTGYRNAYRIQVDGDSSTIGSYKGVTNALELKSYRDYHKRNLDIMAIITVVWYALNIVDAAVDAHLFHWNVDDKLALDLYPVAPSLSNSTASFGFSFQLSFRQPPAKKLFQL